MPPALQERLPFPVRALQVDGGSEFMAQFEAGLRGGGHPAVRAPAPQSQAQWPCGAGPAHAYGEFYECCPAAPTVAALGAALREWERTYNEVRPHQSLGYLTPKEFWESYQRDPAAALAALPKPKRRRKEALSER